MPKTPRTWKGARTPSGLKRVRQAKSRGEVLQPRRSAAKTLVAKALRLTTEPTNGADPNAALLEALSALDRAAKSGAIHPNAAARRKSRLTRHVNKALGGVRGQTVGHAAKTTSKAQAAKAARARIAASKADKAKGAQTAAGKARAALTKTTRSEGAAATAAEPTAKASTAKPKSGAARTTARSTSKAAPKPAAKKPAAKSATAKKAAPKKPATKPAAKKPAKG
ncbi:MAG: 30S ribosomal protein S20 [Chloroflexota bacterium]|nr:30S ribosomal protein S20 [Chloroflexota bacterium]